MKREPMLKIDSELGKRIALTSEHFTNATIWDCRPKGFYVVQLVPRSPADMRLFFELASKIATPMHIVAQPDWVNKIAEEFGYDLSVDAAGTPEWNNAAQKFLF